MDHTPPMGVSPPVDGPRLRLVRGGMSTADPAPKIDAPPPAPIAVPADVQERLAKIDHDKALGVENIKADTMRRQIADAQKQREHAERLRARRMQFGGALIGAIIVIGGSVLIGHFIDKDAAKRLLEVGGYLATGLAGWLFRGVVIDCKAPPARRSVHDRVGSDR